MLVSHLGFAGPPGRSMLLTVQGSYPSSQIRGCSWIPRILTDIGALITVPRKDKQAEQKIGRKDKNMLEGHLCSRWKAWRIVSTCRRSRTTPGTRTISTGRCAKSFGSTRSGSACRRKHRQSKREGSRAFQSAASSGPGEG